MKKILVIAAHPDDEILGCGASIALWVKKNYEVHVVIAAEGLTSRDASSKQTQKSEITELHQTALAANQLLGVKDVSFYNFPDNRMDSVDRLDVIKQIEQKINSFNPDEIYTHHPFDLNVDHRRLSEAVTTATRPLPGQKIKKVCFFEVVSSTGWVFNGATAQQFSPNIFIDVSPFMDLKIKALGIYKSEMRDFPHARSIEAVKALAAYRGSTAGYQSAEAFMLGRELISL